MDTHQDFSAEMLERFCSNFVSTGGASPFFSRLVEGVLDSGTEIDAILGRFSRNWKMSRMSCVDRNVMRIAVYEILYCDDIPPKVSINEAVDIGKKFGSEDSGAFINGILDSVRMSLHELEADGNG